ncbi:MAG: non-ribosomal peptide synthetase/polyketide synthase [Candidatus Puniceispirillum sp.]|nr:non-ribosomal peptide synthetase/polyketide synthase [Candidatus Puniceispirillum sp.]
MSKHKKYSCAVTEILESHAKNLSDNVAVVYNNTEYTYKKLNEKSNQIALLLQKRGVQSNDFVGILLEPSTDFIIFMLAIIKAGAIYLPLDVLAPDKRISDILKDAKPKFVITDEQYLTKTSQSKTQIFLINNIYLESISNDYTNPKLTTTATSPLYLLYTSGSTGKPKGVLVPHQAIINVTTIENTLKVTSKDSFSQFNNLAFDGSTFEIWSTLLNGAKLVIIPIDIRGDHKKLKQELEKNHVNTAFFPTSYFHQIAKSYPETFNTIDRLMFGGEQVNKNIVKNFIQFRRKNELSICLINGYGPTETTAYVCRQIITDKNINDVDLSSIGTAIKNIKLYVLNEELKQANEGELYVSGINIALGYHKSNLNNSRFLSNPFDSKAPYQKLYKTGDIVRKLPNGELLWLERTDDQVKIGGFRIHLKEIEEQLSQYSKISMASVSVEIGGGSHKILAAYLVPTSKKTILHPEKITAFLSKKLPSYMIPTKYIKIDEMPLTLAGKVDKNNLSHIPHTELSYHRDILSDNIIENVIKDIWKSLLNIKTIDPYINLFDLGANSLLLTEACSVINKKLSSELQISDILSHPTIHKLSQYLQGNIAPLNKQKNSTVSPYNIAIVGMSCRFPKANSLEEFWENLCNGKECLDTFEKEYLQSLYNNPKVLDDSFIPVKGIISNADMFDAHFFGFNPYDAKITDPQHRIFLECVWDALEHAGFAPNKNPDKKVSVFAGMADSTYLLRNILRNNNLAKEADYFQERIATSIGMLSTQISYRLNLKGRSLNINTACSTGLVTVDHACQDLILNNCDVAIAGAIHISTPIKSGYHYQKNSILSQDGHCRPFSKSANGTVFSDGGGVVILKRLEDALRDNDTVYAVIKSCGINNDGSEKLGFTAPSTQGQMTCIQEALNQAALNPEDINYVETHGTATALGDVIEIEALASVYRQYTKKKQFCLIGSCKANIGHTDVAAGIAGLIKTTLALHYKKIPPLINFDAPNPNIKLEKTPFYVNKELTNWPNVKEKNACISSFGFGGTNAHMIIGEFIESNLMNDRLDESKEQLAIMSAKTQKALEEKIRDLENLEQSANNSTNFSDLIYTMQHGREDFSWRTFGTGRNLTEVITNLREENIKICDEHTPHNIIFMFPGQGTQYYGMAQELIKNCPIFEKIIRQGFLHAKNYIDCDLAEIINNPTDSRLYLTQFTQPALFIIEYALAKTLIEMGVKPTSMIGHSLGEYVAACIAGIFSFENGIALICERALLMQNTPRGEMLAIECEKEDALHFLTISNVELALHNTQNNYIFSGTIEEIKILKDYLSNHQYSHKSLKTQHAFHSHLMEKTKPSFKEIFLNIPLQAPTIPIVSNLTGDWLSAQEAIDEEYWYSQMRQTVKFYDGIKLLLPEQNSIFIEIGPGNSLGSFVKNISRKMTSTPDIIHTLPSHHQKTNDYSLFLTALGKIWQAGIRINWEKTAYGNAQKHISIPTYPFQKQSYWVEPDNKFLSSDEVRQYKPIWSRQEDYNKALFSKSLEFDNNSYNWIIFKDSTGIGDQIISILKQNNISPITIEFSKNYREENTNFTIDPSKKAHYLQLLTTIKNTVKNPIIIHTASCSNSGSMSLEPKEVEKQLTLGFYSLLYLTQVYNDIFGSDIHGKITLITNDTQMILGTEKMNPINAALIGAARVIMQEYDNLKIKLIDVCLAEKLYNDAALFNYIVRFCTKDNWYETFMNAFRNNYLWDLMYTPINEMQRKTNRLKDNGVYLFTGGLGGIALSCCEAIARTVKNPKFILLSRSAFPSKSEWEPILANENHKYYIQTHQLKTLEDLGAQYYIHQVDITDFTTLKLLIEQSTKRFSKIDGLIHAAGILNSELTQLKSKSSAEQVLAPKLLGTYNLIAALKNTCLDFVVLKSSLASLLGGLGLVDYAAANSCLDSFAASDLLSFSNFVSTINWNTWQEIGMAVNAQKDGKINFLGQDNNISTQQGQRVFLDMLRANESNVIISKTDLNQQKTKADSAALPTIIRDDLPITTKYYPPNNKIESKLVEIWQHSLGISNLGIDDDFFSLGGHSLKALSLIEKINSAFQTSLPMTQIYNTSTIKKLGTILSTKPTKTDKPSILIPLKINEKNHLSLFLCHPISGLINCFHSFMQNESLPISVYGLQDPSIENGTIMYDNLFEMAQDYLSEIKKVQPQGPYYLMGYSFGGCIFHEIANILYTEGETIALLAMIDSWADYPPFQQEDSFKEHFRKHHQNLPKQMINLAWKREQLLLKHTFSKINQKMHLFKASMLFDEYKKINSPNNGWDKYNDEEIIIHSIDADHESIMNKKNSSTIMRLINNKIRNI